MCVCVCVNVENSVYDQHSVLQAVSENTGDNASDDDDDENLANIVISNSKSSRVKSPPPKPKLLNVKF